MRYFCNKLTHNTPHLSTVRKQENKQDVNSNPFYNMVINILLIMLSTRRLESKLEHNSRFDIASFHFPCVNTDEV